MASTINEAVSADGIGRGENDPIVHRDKKPENATEWKVGHMRVWVDRK